MSSCTVQQCRPDPPCTGYINVCRTSTWGSREWRHLAKQVGRSCLRESVGSPAHSGPQYRRDIPATYGVCQLLGRSLYILDYLTQIPHPMSMSDMRLLVIPVTTNSSIFILVLLMCLLPDWPNAPYIGIFASWTFDQNVAGDRDQRGKFWSYTKSKDDLYSMCYAYSKRIVAYYRC